LFTYYNVRVKPWFLWIKSCVVTSLHTWQWRRLGVCVYVFVCQRSWDGKGKRCHRTWKKVAVDLFKNGEKISDNARISQQPRSTISDIITYLVQINAFLYDQYDRKTPILARDEVEAHMPICQYANMGLDMEMIL
jgi:hypothetical protein